uniref:Uncharacterized protein n=1 Tax=Arundo donax TaxID=35708 RepID=A0A0A9AAJ4_ARUDO
MNKKHSERKSHKWQGN